MTADIASEVSAEIRSDIAAARERAELIEALQGSPLWERLRVPDQHDFRDAGNPLVKVHPDVHHWSRWAERTEFDEREP